MVERAPHPLVVPPPHGLCWRRSERRGRAEAPSTHAELVVLHALSGRARYVIDGAVVTLRPGTVLWALSGQAHFLLSEEAGFDMWVMLVSERLLTADMRADPAMPPLRLGDKAEAVEARGLPRAASDELDRLAARCGAAEGAARGAGLVWWLHRAWTHWRAASGDVAGRLHPAVDRAARLIREDPARPIAEIASEAGLSAGRLGRVFRAETGRWLVEFRTEAKLDRALEALESGGARTLLAAALDGGFGSYSQFYRAFERRFGRPPRTYLAEREG